MNWRGVGILLCFLFLFSRSGDAFGYEPTGRLLLVSVFINNFLQPNESEAANLTLTCSTPSRSGRLQFAYEEVLFSEVVVIGNNYDLKVDLLPHESVQCELAEVMEDEEMDNSHGDCQLTYARFLGPTDNTVTCHLNGGSRYALRMDCGENCPKPVPIPKKPYCRKSKVLLPVDTGNGHTLSDGSPGFAMYAPGTHCTWKLPRDSPGATNFLFSRMDLGSGDVLTAYESPDGTRRRKIKDYTEYSTPESISTSAKYLILELKADDVDEGLGFEGFYYVTEEVVPPVAIAPKKQRTNDTSSFVPSVGRKFT